MGVTTTGMGVVHRISLAKEKIPLIHVQYTFARPPVIEKGLMTLTGVTSLDDAIGMELALNPYTRTKAHWQIEGLYSLLFTSQ